MSQLARFGLASLVALSSASPTAAQLHESKLMASDASGLAFLGRTVAISGDTLAAGAPSDDAGGIGDAGAVYVWVRAGGVWQQQAKLVDGDAATNDRFGSGLALDGDTLMGGVPEDDYGGSSGSGSVTVFLRSGTNWTEDQTLTPSNSLGSGRFGASIGLCGDLCLIGSPRDGLGSTGAVFVFTRTGNTWAQTGKILAPGGGMFGSTLDLSDDGSRVVVGAASEDHSGLDNAGAAYVFVLQGGAWVLESRLAASDPAAGDGFGGAVAIHGDRVVVGAAGHDIADRTDAGSAHVFVRTGATWSAQQTLTLTDAGTEDFMGAAVAVWGDRILAGVPRDDLPGAVDAGSVAVFEHTAGSWNETERLTGGDTDRDDFFGGTFAVGDEWTVVAATGVTAPGRGPGSIAAGAVYTLREAWSDLGAALAGTQGEPQLTGDGDLSGGTLGGLSLVGARPSAPATLVLGLSIVDAPFKGGVLVPSPDVLVPLATDGTGALDVAWTWPSGLPADVTLLFQYWIADPAGPFGYAASNALAGVTP